MSSDLKTDRKEVYVGIDVSTTGTAIVKYTDKGGYEYHLISPIPISKTNVNYDKIEHPLVTYHYYDNSKELCVHSQIKKFMHKFSYIVNKLVKGVEFDKCIFGVENFAFSLSGNNAHKLYFYGYEVRKFLYDRKLPYKDVHIQSNKKYFAGHGDSCKTQMIEELFRREEGFRLTPHYHYLSDDRVVFKKKENDRNAFKRLKLEDIADARALCEFIKDPCNLIPKKKKAKKRKRKIKLPTDKIEF